MAKSSTYWDKRALRRLNESEKYSEKYINNIKRIYNQSYKNIDKQLESIYRNYSKETGIDIQKLKELLTRSETKKTWEQLKKQGLDKYIKDNYKSRISRLEQLQAQIYAKAKQIYPKEELENTMCYKGVINQSYYKTMFDTQMGTGFNFNFSTIDNKTIESLLSERWSGKNYSERIWGNTDILADSVSEIIGGAILSGQSIELTARQIRDRFNIAKHYAERLVRTETNHFNNEVDAMAYKELGLDKYVFVATLDSRTSEICQSMDNQVFKFSERKEGINYPPLHPNCRSKTRAYLGEEEEKLLKRRARNPITGKTEIVDNISYKDWYRKYVSNEFFDISSLNKSIVSNNVQKTINMLPSNIRNVCKDTKFKIGNINKYVSKSDTIYLKPDSDVYSVLHEIGHALDKKLDLYNNSEFVNIVSNKFSKYKYQDFTPKKFIIDNNEKILYYINDSNNFVSEYQATLYPLVDKSYAFLKSEKANYYNAREYFPEGLKYYYKQPELLKEKDLDLFNFIDKLIGG